MSYLIRTAEHKDLPFIQSIYNHEVLNAMATWNHEEKDLHYFEQWFSNLQQHNFPLFVIEHIETKNIAGYADYSTFRHISGFNHTVEHSIFINPAFARLGLGSQLLKSLMKHARQQNVHVMVAAIDHENLASIRLHEKLGFKQTGYMPQVGQKFGTWRDLVFMQIIL